MKKFGLAFFTIVAYVITLLVTYYVHMRHFNVNVVFYASIIDAVLAAVIVASVGLLLKLFRHFTGLERLQLLLICLLGGYIFAISIPTVIDRSLSFYILEKLQQRGGGIREDAFKKVFTEEYVREHHLVEVRLTEQLESGTIRIVNGCVKLTPRGGRLATFSRFYRRHLLPTRRLLMGRYTDDLTDPFRGTQTGANYVCK